MHRYPGGANWDDLRFVLAVADRGSVSAAARALGVNHATVLRRVAAFEAAEGMVVFDRTPQGYVVPPDKARVIEAAREAEAAFAAVSRTIRGSTSASGGPIRVTSTDTFCVTVLPGIVAQIQAALAGVQIDLVCANAHLDLARMDADLTVRPAPRLPDDLTGEQVGMLGMAVYAATDLRESDLPEAHLRESGRRDPDLREPDLREAGLREPDLRHPRLPEPARTWLALRGTLVRSPVATWLAREIAPERITGGADSFVVLREMVAQGLGLSFLPCILGDGDLRLRRLPDAAPPFATPIWVASHADLAQSPRLRQARARLVEGLRACAPALAGTG